MTTMTTPANVSDQLMGLYGPEQLREVERLSTYNYRARLAGGEIVLAVVRGDMLNFYNMNKTTSKKDWDGAVLESGVSEENMLNTYAPVWMF